MKGGILKHRQSSYGNEVNSIKNNIQGCSTFKKLVDYCSNLSTLFKYSVLNISYLIYVRMMFRPWNRIDFNRIGYNTE